MGILNSGALSQGSPISDSSSCENNPYLPQLMVSSYRQHLLSHDFSFRFPTSMVPAAVSYQRSAIYLLPTTVCRLASAALANTKRHPDLRKSILTVPASSTSSRIAAITCSRRRNGALSVVLSGLIDYQPFSIIAIPPSLSLLSTPFSTHHEFPTFLSPISRISLLLQGDLLPLAADRQGN